MTTAEVKSILGISDSTYDTQIAFFIPYVARDIVSYIGHAFQDGYVYRESASYLALAPDTSTGDYITDDEEEFLVKGFLAGQDIAVEGGYSNVGVYTVAAASAGQLTLDDKGVLIAQDQGSTADDHTIGTIRISRIKWPREIKLPAAKMVWYLIDQAKVSDVQSESLDDYSVTYAGTNAYPTRVIMMLDKFRRPVFG
jgi:hypothetical protein